MAGAGKGTGAPRVPKPTELTRVRTRLTVGETQVCVAAFDGAWCARLSYADAERVFVPAPEGLFVPRVASRWMLIDEATCQVCGLTVGLGALTMAGQQRAHRRLYRMISLAPAECSWGPGRIVCKACGRGEHVSPKSFVRIQAHTGAIEAELSVELRLSDQGYEVAHTRTTVALSEAALHEAEADLFERAAKRLRQYWEVPSHPLDVLDPNESEADSLDTSPA